MDKLSKLAKVGLTVLLSTTVLAACGNSSNEKSDSSNSDAKTSKKSTISWMALLHTASTPTGDIQSKLEKYTGMKIDFKWVPAANQTEKINASIAAKTLPDIVSLADTSNTTVRQALKAGQFWDISKYIKDYPNLNSISKKTIATAKMDGHLYWVPSVKAPARYGVIVRQDWLDNLHLQAPKTMDDLAKVAQAFTEDDPDGNGKKDTVGIVDRNESFKLSFKTIAGLFGAGNEFAVVNGKVTPSFMQPEYTKALKWYRNIYKHGWMNSDFSVMAKTDQGKYIGQGKGGIVICGLMDASNYVTQSKGTPQEGKMKWKLINNITYDGKTRIVSDTNGGAAGGYAISKSSVKSVADLKVVLKFLNDMMDKKPFVWMTNGVKNEHYRLNDKGEYEILDDSKWQQEVQPYTSSRISELVANLKSTDALKNEQNEKIIENSKHAVYNPTLSLDSKTYDERWSTLAEPVADAYYKYMMGELDMNGWKAAIKQFRSDGGDQIIKEFTESYQKSK